MVEVGIPGVIAPVIISIRVHSRRWVVDMMKSSIGTQDFPTSR